MKVFVLLTLAVLLIDLVFAGFGCPDDEKVCNKHCMGLNCKAGYCDEAKNWLWCACSECYPHATVTPTSVMNSEGRSFVERGTVTQQSRD
ncbi:defensin Cg-Defm-like [Crassostrea angulata]|uniref:defensin Cg-Defm-like n=1 Tax=Magallana angulata TaxID=2784310 RepID=UPI0022B1D62B|nr:defensin Cg-Defm-like [Crassostrea angulata]